MIKVVEIDCLMGSPVGCMDMNEKLGKVERVTRQEELWDCIFMLARPLDLAKWIDSR